MNTEINALAQIHEAQDKIADALSDPSLTRNEIILLQDSSIALKNMERSIVNKIGQDLIDSLTLDSAKLADLAKEIDKASASLSNIATTVGKLVKLADALISIISTAATVGL